jgi:hypothetical protein
MRRLPPTAKAAIAVNPPFRWWDGAAIGVSLYVGVTNHHAIRGNYANYEYEDNLIQILGANEGVKQGRITDFGVAWMYFPRGLCDGLSLEAGLLRRGRDTSSRMELDTLHTQTTTYSARAMIGWSWLFTDHLFISVAAGVSAGHETGTETTSFDELLHKMPTTSDVGRQTIAGEWLMRIGATF